MDDGEDRRTAFGKLLFGYRRRAGLSQADLARASGMSVRALRDLEHGRAQGAQRRSAEVLADALRLGGDERESFLIVAKEGRRRTARILDEAGLCMVPSAVPDLLGRDRELARLRDEARTGGVVTIVGHPGVGKTALAVRAAHDLSADFPDGCLAIDMRGMDQVPLSTRVALDRLLRALGVAQSEIPVSEPDQANLLRLLMDGRKVLLLLDDAAAEAQIRPLLVTGNGCLTLVTCRRTLSGLAEARTVRLAALSGPDAVGLLKAIVGPDRVLAEPGKAIELVALCGNLPLAVRIAGNRLATRPHWSLSYLVEQLHDERTRLSSLSAGDIQVRSAFAVSYRRLSPAARLFFRRLSLLPGADFGVELAEVATDASPIEVRRNLDELVGASLLQVTSEPDRFQFHDLIRLFAHERLGTEEKPGERDRLSERVFDHLFSTAMAAAKVFFPDALETGPFSSRDSAAEWLTREYSHWLAALRTAGRSGRHREVVDLVLAMHWYSDFRYREYPWDEIFGFGVRAARALGGRTEEATLLNFLGWAQRACVGDNATALATHREALAVAVEAGSRREQAWAHAYLGSVLMRLGHGDQALEHARRSCEMAGDFELRTAEFSVRNGLGRVLQSMGRHEEALDVHRALLLEVEDHRDETHTEMWRWHRAVIMTEVGNSLSGLGRTEHAAAAYHEVRSMHAEAGLAILEADVALLEGVAWRASGQNGRARECLERALSVFEGPVLRAQRERTLSELALLPEV
ncbi:ATP-binding protein [Amycolatopsis sp. NPDC049868]|uniref:ATP-binding protein n=1 Tax=Amycolatopsis sp. NPDC049868 TaxID=3363934 RepID=UPI0037BD7DBD